jgi:hypothetical protein
VYGRDGRLQRVVSPFVREVAVAHNRLVVLTRQDTLQVYEARSGRLLHSWPVHARGETPSLDACCGLAAYIDAPAGPGSTASTLHVVDLVTGRDRVVAKTANDSDMIRDLQLGPSGLVYSSDLRQSQGSRIHFLPLAQIRP